MFNIETIEKLAKVEGDNLVSFYLDLDKTKYSSVDIKNKIKDLLKSVHLNNFGKQDLEKKIIIFLEKVSGNTKSVAAFYSKDHWYSYVFSYELEDQIFVDSFFNLEPLLFLLSENRNVAVMMLNAEEARLISVFLGEVRDHRHLEDRIIRRHSKGGWSQGRFSRRIDGEIKQHLKHSVDYLIKMNKIYKFDFIFLRSDPKLENEFKRMLPDDLGKKIRGDIKIDFNASAEKIISMVDKLVTKNIAEEEKNEMEEIENLSKIHHGKDQIASGLVEVARALYDNKAEKIMVNDGFSEPGLYCHFCGYIATSEEYCPYDQTPNNRTKNVVTILLDQAISKSLRVEVLKDNETLREMGDIIAILRR